MTYRDERLDVRLPTSGHRLRIVVARIILADELYSHRLGLGQLHVSISVASSPQERGCTHPVYAEQVLVRPENTFCVPSTVDEVLRRWGRDLPLAPEELIQVLALGIRQDNLDLRRHQKLPFRAA